MGVITSKVTRNNSRKANSEPEIHYRSHLLHRPTSQPSMKQPCTAVDTKLSLSLSILSGSEVQTEIELPCHFRFLDLPPEIRNMIYKEIVVVGKIFYSPNDHDLSNSKRFRGHSRFRKPELQLLQVSRQIHSEVEPLYLSQNLFVLPVRWFKFYPFRECLGSNRRYQRPLFSNAGLSCVRSVSIALDQTLTQPAFMNFEDWEYNEMLGEQSIFLQLTQHERYEMIHDGYLRHTSGEWWAVLNSLTSFTNGLDYIEMDFTNAFCPVGDCRPIHLLSMCKIRKVQPEAIDILGMLNNDEKQDFMDCALRGGIKHRQLRKHYGLRFRKPGDNKIWDKWMISEKGSFIETREETQNTSVVETSKEGDEGDDADREVVSY